MEHVKNQTMQQKTTFKLLRVCSASKKKPWCTSPLLTATLCQALCDTDRLRLSGKRERLKKGKTAIKHCTRQSFAFTRCHNSASDVTSNTSLIVDFFIVPAHYKHRRVHACMSC